ncbi:hypothetical protein ACWFMI_14900 [Nocardiopsis terrae]
MSEDDDLKQLLEVLNRVQARSKQLEKDTSAGRPQPKSSLAADDAKSQRWKVSPGAYTPLMASLDHLHCLRSSLVAGEKPPNIHLTIHQGAQFSLVRNALENAARSVWILTPSTRMERIKRNLSLQKKEYGDAGHLLTELGQNGDAWAKERKDKVDAEARRIGIPEIDPATGKPVRLRPAQYGEMVKLAGDQANGNGNWAKAVWHLCSALAHGDTQGMLNGLEKEIVGSENGVAIAKMTASIPNLLTFTQVAVVMLHQAFELYRLRATCHL